MVSADVLATIHSPLRRRALEFTRGDHPTADDLTQDTLLIVIERPPIAEDAKTVLRYARQVMRSLWFDGYEP